MGRRSTYTPELAAEICARISTGETLVSICKDEWMPDTRVVGLWKESHPEFSADFGRARDDGFDAIAAQCFEIANTPLEGVETTSKDGKVIEEKRADMLGHRKLQIETRLKLLAKWDPRRYGDKFSVDANITVTDLARRMQDMEDK